MRDTQYHRAVDIRATARPTRTESGPAGSIRLIATDPPGGPWLVRGPAGEPCLWLGDDGRVCDVARRYDGRPADVLIAWLGDNAEGCKNRPTILLAASQLSAYAERLFGIRSAKLITAGILARPETPPDPPESRPVAGAPPRARRRASPPLTHRGQVALFGGPRV